MSYVRAEEDLSCYGYKCFCSGIWNAYQKIKFIKYII